MQASHDEVTDCYVSTWVRLPCYKFRRCGRETANQNSCLGILGTLRVRLVLFLILPFTTTRPHTWTGVREGRCRLRSCRSG